MGSDGFEPQNELEVELVRAAHEPAFRDVFLRELLGAEVFLALLPSDGRVTLGPGGEASVPPGTRLELGAVERDGKRLFPIFTSPVRAQAHYRQDHFIASDKLRDLFARHPDTEFALNPSSDYAVDLFRSDIDALMVGAFSTH